MISYLMQTDGAAQQAAPGSGILGFLPFILMIVIIYFLMIRPQQKKQKELQRMLDDLKVNDRVLTNGGIIGKIQAIKKDKGLVVIKVDEATGTKIEFQRSSIIGILNEATQVEEKPATN